MTKQDNTQSDHYNCEPTRIASMPGGGTTIKDVHDAIHIYTNKRIEETLNNIKEHINNLQTYKLSEDSTNILIEKDEVVGAIEAERNKLKESK